MTEVCTKVIRIFIARNIKKIDPTLNAISDLNTLPGNIQQSWCILCEVAFKTIHNNQTVFSQLEIANDFPSGLERIYIFGFLESETDRTSQISFHFLHQILQEYLAALHIVKQPPDTQHKIFQSCAKLKQFVSIWRFFFGILFSSVKHERTAVITVTDQLIQVLSRVYYFTDRYLLCHCAFEAKSKRVTSQVVKSLNLNDSIHFGTPLTAYDCTAVLYVIENIDMHCCVEINFRSCNLGEQHIIELTNALSIKGGRLQVKMLDLSENKLVDDVVAHLFVKASSVFQSLEKLFIRNNEIKNRGIWHIFDTLTKLSTQNIKLVDLSYNPLTKHGLQIFQSAISSSTLANLEVLFMQGTLGALAKDKDTITWVLTFSKVLCSHCQHLRRLDLSSNDLGEPGNPAIGEISSQLTTLRKDFDLCLNREYMAEVDNNFIAVMEDSIIKKGTIDYTVVHGVFVGPGRAGKLGEGPT